MTFSKAAAMPWSFSAFSLTSMSWHGLTYDPTTGLSTMALDLRDDRSTPAGFQENA
jgi:hypothetical protein